MIYTIADAIARRLRECVPMGDQPKGTDVLHAPMRLKTIDVWQDQTSVEIKELGHYLPAAFIEISDVNFAPMGDGSTLGPSQIIVHVISSTAADLFNSVDHDRRVWLYRYDALIATVHAALERYEGTVEPPAAQRDQQRPYAPSMWSAMTLVSIRPTMSYEEVLHTQLVFRALLTASSALKPVARTDGEVTFATYVYGGAPTPAESSLIIDGN